MTAQENLSDERDIQDRKYRREATILLTALGVVAVVLVVTAWVG